MTGAVSVIIFLGPTVLTIIFFGAVLAIIFLGEDFLLAAWRTLEDLDPALIFLIEEALAFDVLAVFKLKFLALVLAAALPEVFLTEFAIFLKYV